MKSISLVVFWIAIASCLFAQEKVVVKKVKPSEQTVTVDLNKSADGERTIKIVTDNNGEKEVIEWTDNGEIPDDIKKKLKEQDIDIHILEDSEGGNIFVKVDDDRKVRKEVIVIKKSDGDEVMEFEWDGEGEMPAEMKELLEEHDIQLGELHERHDKDKVKAHMRVLKDKRKKMRNKAKKHGRDINIAEKKKYKIVIKDGDGDEKVMEWHSDDEMPGGMHEFIHEDGVRAFHLDRRNNRRIRRGNDFVWFSDDNDSKLSNAYMGAQIESVENGAQILDVMKDSPADKAGLTKGDIVQRINGARSKSMDDLLSILTFFEPNDQIELSVLRDGKEKKLNLTLGKRPDAYK